MGGCACAACDGLRTTYGDGTISAPTTGWDPKRRRLRKLTPDERRDWFLVEPSLKLLTRGGYQGMDKADRAYRRAHAAWARAAANDAALVARLTGHRRAASA